MSIPISQSIPTPTLPTLVSMFFFYVWVSFSALQVSSSIPFFYIPHVCVNIYLFFSEYVILQPEVGVGGIWQCLESFWIVRTCEGVLLVSSWQRSDAVNTLRWTGQLLPSPTKNYPVQNVNRATVEESFASAMDVKLWIRRLCSFLTLPRIHLHLTSVTMLCLSKEFLFEKTCCDGELLVSKGSSLMEICRQMGENLGCREFSGWLQEVPAGRPPLSAVRPWPRHLNLMDCPPFWESLCPSKVLQPLSVAPLPHQFRSLLLAHLTPWSPLPWDCLHLAILLQRLWRFPAFLVRKPHTGSGFGAR